LSESPVGTRELEQKNGPSEVKRMNGQAQEIYCAKTNERWIDQDLAMGGMAGIIEEDTEDKKDWVPLSRTELARLQWQIEHPDLADPVIGTLPVRKFSVEGEAKLRKAMREEQRAKRNQEMRRVVEQGNGQLSIAIWAC